MEAMMTDTRYGASPEDWLHFNNVLDVGLDLLPVVSNPTASISPTSSMKQLGKTPSQYASDGTVIGIRDWTGHYASDQQIRRWSEVDDYGICLQTRITKALDIDVGDAAMVEEILEAVRLELGIELPRRFRENSPKCLLPFRIAGDEGQYAKRVLRTAHGAIEFLGHGQQYVAIGTHTSGARYQWAGGLPVEIPELSADEFEGLWQRLVASFAVEPPVELSASSRKRGDDIALADPVADFLDGQGLILGEQRDGSLLIACPWDHEHTSGEPGDGSTVWFRAGSRGHDSGHFKCLHAHCARRSDGEFFEAIGYEEDVASLFPELPPFDFPGVGDTPPGTDTPPKKSRFIFEDAGVFADRPSPGWIVKGVIPRAGLGIVYGESGSGKSFFIFDLIAAIVRGVEWRGHRVTRGRCAYIAAEGSGGFRNRIKAYQQHHGVDLRGSGLMMLAAAPNFLLGEDVKDLVSGIRASGGADIIVVDTYAQVTPGANENTSEDMGKALRHCALIHEATGALVILVHHAGKDTSRGARGWSGNRAAADFEIEVLITDDGRMARVRKQKDGKDDESWGFALQDVNIGIDGDGDVITSCVVVDAPLPEDAPSVRGAAARGGKKEPKRKLGTLQKTIMEALSELALGGDVKVDELVAKAAEKMPDTVALRTRKWKLGRALEDWVLKEDCPLGVKEDHVFER
jgi:hypothetical protein